MKKNNSAKLATIWNLIERFSTQVVTFLIGIVLARLLSPDDYGIVGITTVFIAVSNVFIDSGFANGLIRKPNRTEKDLTTAFIFNIVVGFTVYSLLFLTAPFIAEFFSEPKLVILVRLIGINVVFLSFSIVQTAILTSKLDMKVQALINLGSIIPSGFLAIYLAYKSFGVYSLAAQTLCSSFLKMVLLWWCTGWKPREHFSKESFSYLWGFGSKLLGANLIGTFFNEVYSVLIGKFIGKTDLGYYSKASHLSQNVNGTTTGVVQKISLPVLSRYQNDSEILKDKFRNLMQILVLLISPLSAILFFMSKEIIVCLWTDKWLESVVIFQLLILGTMFNPISQLSLSLLQVVNRTDTILKLEIPKKVTYCILIAVGFQYGVKGLAFVQIIINIIASLINMYPTKRILNYNYTSQLFDVFKYMIVAYLVGIFCFYISFLFSGLIKILIYTVIFIFIYTVILYFTKDKFLYPFFSKYLKRFSGIIRSI